MSARKLVGVLASALLFAGCDGHLLDLLEDLEGHPDHTPGAVRFEVPIEVLPLDAAARVAGVDVDKVKPGSATLGTFNGTISIQGRAVSSAGDDDVFLAALNGDGKLAWLRRFGDEQAQTAADVSIDYKDHVVFAGRFLGRMDFGNGVVITSEGTATNAFVAKLDRDGRALWALGIPLVGDCCFISVDKVATDASGDVFITGPLEGTARFAGHDVAAHGANNYLVKLSSTGSFLWAAVFRGPDQAVVSLRVRPDGQPVVAENDVRGVRFFLLRWSANGELLMDRAYPGSFSQVLHDMVLVGDNIVISGTGVIGTPGTPEENDRDFLAMLDPQGNPIWIIRFTDRAADHLASEPNGLIFTAGRAFLPGTPLPSMRAFVAEFNSAGAQQWLREFGPGQRIDRIAASCPSKIVFAGALGDTNFGDNLVEPTPDLFIESLQP